MQIVCALDDLDGSPKAILRGRARAGASSDPNAGNSVIRGPTLNESSGSLIFFDVMLCTWTIRKRQHGCLRAHLLQDCKELRAAVGADAEILGQAGRLQGEALGAAARRLKCLSGGAIEHAKCDWMWLRQPRRRLFYLMHAIGGKAARLFGGAVVTEQLAASPALPLPTPHKIKKTKLGLQHHTK